MLKEIIMRLAANRKMVLFLAVPAAVLALIIAISLYILPEKEPSRVSKDTPQERVENETTPAITHEAPGNSVPYQPEDIYDLSHLEDDILQEVELKTEQIRQLNKTLHHDRKLAAKFDIPDEDLATTPSDVLCKHFFAVTPMRVWFGMYDDRNMGITRAIRGSKTLGTLFGRKDVIPGIVKVYKETPLEPEKMQDMDAGTTSMALMTIDEFMIYPPVFERSVGYEKEILSILCDRYKRMEKVNASRPPNDPIYSATYNSTKTLALLLVERVKPGLHNSLVTETSYSRMFARIEDCVKEMN